MNIGIENIKDLLEVLSYIVTSGSLIALYVTYKQSNKQIHFSAIEKCVNDFRTLEKFDNNLEKKFAHYIDLVNEELFYIENNYLPKEVAIEWIDGMIDYLPFKTKSGKFIDSFRYNEILNDNNLLQFLKDYPRIAKFINIYDDVNFDLIRLEVDSTSNITKRKQERDKLIFQLLNNLNIKYFDKFKYKREIASR